MPRGSSDGSDARMAAGGYSARGMKRRIFFGVAAATLSGCGFEPLYGRFGDRSIADDLATIKVQLIANRSGQILRNHLLDALTPLGEPPQPAYTMRVELIEPLPQDLGITRNEAVVRYSYSSVARFRLIDSAGKEVLLSDASGLSSYEVTNSEFATVSGQANARDRVLEEIANEIKSQLAVWFRSRRGRTA
jgi:LPS-assembly lipoprotein